MEKCKIIKVGTIEGGWIFMGNGKQSAIKINQEQENIVGGYTVSELVQISEFYHRGISDYKASLKEAIENRKKFVEECNPPDAHYDARKKGGLHEIEKVLELLETVKPKE